MTRLDLSAHEELLNSLNIPMFWDVLGSLKNFTSQFVILVSQLKSGKGCDID
jgi:hypothetical protein